MRRIAPFTALAIPLLSLFLATPAAALQQPNGQNIPTAPGCNGGKPTGLAAVFSCICEDAGVCNIGDPCPSPGQCSNGVNSTCETTMWHEFNDNTCIPTHQSGLDPVAEAATMPETFHPACPLTFSLDARGTALFKNGFGWYNVTGQKPSFDDLHVMQDCNAPQGSTAVLDLANEPGYLGGDIGFFLVTPESHTQNGSCAGGNCCATVARAKAGEGYVYFSERKYNPDFVGQNSYIHLLVYQSHVWQEKFYFAWEDTFNSSSGNFTDFVSGVSGVHCAGGGNLCDTGKKGVCGAGISMCQGGVLGCSQVFQPGDEQCNGVDDDCDGQIDQGATCPPEQICHNGACVPHCSDSEFPCFGNTVCDAPSGLCLDPGCQGKTCAVGEVCTAGVCRTPCADVICPKGQDCVSDVCVDLCKGVSCATGQVCRQGKCFGGCNQCDGISCSLPEKCEAQTGRCVDTSCPGGCPSGEICDSGTCKDACSGVACPPGQTCSNGDCHGPGTGGAGGGGGMGFGGFGGSGAGTGTGNGGQGQGGGSGGDGAMSSSSSGCGCAAAAPSNRAMVAMAAMALGAPFMRRRSRKPRDGKKS